MRRVPLSLLVVAGCAVTTTSAPTPAPAPARECPPRAPRLELTADGEAVELVSVTARVTITRGLATTRLELTFRNDRDRVLEGELLVPLPRGASLSSFALEVNGSMQEAAVVERERARVAFESVERRKIDPGLVEWSHGDSFRTRVYPIPARGTKRVALGFEQEVSDRFELALGAPMKGTLTVDGVETAIDGPVSVALATLSAPEGVIDAQGAFFARVPLGAAPEKPLPRRVTVLWDASLSARDRDLEKERALLGRVLEGVEEIRLVTFAHQVLTDERFATPGQLVTRLASVECDGGTRLACLDLAALERETDALLLVSDGISTLGGSLACGAKPLTAIVSAVSADSNALGRLGRVVDVRPLSVLEAAHRVRSRPAELVRVEGAVGTSPAPGASIEGSVLSLAGRVRGTDGPESIEVLVRDEAGVRSVPVPLRRGEGPSRVLARRRVAELLAAPRVDVAAVVSLAKAERIATPYTSFVVLETLADYERYGIEPPPLALRLAVAEQRRREGLKEKETFLTMKASDDDARDKEITAVKREGSISETKLRRQIDTLDARIAELSKREISEGQVARLQRILDGGDAYPAPRSQASIYAEAADEYFARGLRDRAIRTLTNLAELDPGDPQLLRVLAYRLEEAGETALAVSVLEQVALLRPEEPQSFRDLGLAQADLANVTSAAENLARVVRGGWDARFPEVEKIAAHELLHLTAPRSIEADLRIVLTWDANDCDVDLWVTEPSGEKVFYSHADSTSGAHLSRDFTQGYGPEEFVLPHAPPGVYVVEAQFYGDHRQTRKTDTTLRATIFTGYGRASEQRAVVVRRMTQGKQVVELARVTMER